MDFALISSVFETLRITPPSKLTLLEAQTLASASAHYPPFPPDMPALLTGVDSSDLAFQVKKILLAVYPQEHVVFVVREGKMKEERLGDFW
ncbi:MAG: hypothetical protein IPL71_07350 [Anaerolineales bacterium]|uniref:hypothetical protein n=1 Tax=Candidatus Villigracilis proximus TaxID=3140683 RepID=UPI0031363872|nr:hypothetical protein [Anaerolineales bacterium]